MVGVQYFYIPHMRPSSLPRLVGVLALLAPGWAFAQHPTKPSAKPSATPKGVPVVTLTPAGGPLVDQLKREADSATAHGQLPLVDVGAPWCGPCQAFEKTLHDPVMVASLKGARLIHLDFDTWYHDLVNAGYLGSYDLPELFLLKPDGSLGDHFDKGHWQDHADSAHTKTVAEMMGPPLQFFLASVQAQARTASKTP